MTDRQAGIIPSYRTFGIYFYGFVKKRLVFHFLRNSERIMLKLLCFPYSPAGRRHIFRRLLVFGSLVSLSFENRRPGVLLNLLHQLGHCNHIHNRNILRHKTSTHIFFYFVRRRHIIMTYGCIGGIIHS